MFYQLLPEKTLSLKGEKCSGGKKSKQRVTVLLCTNLTGTDKLQPMVIGKSLKPRCFKNIKSLPVNYNANKKAWMTGTIFSEWLLKLDKAMKQKKRKIALLVDNCAAHKQQPVLKNVEIFFFPSSCTSILQPLDMGIIKCLKGYYRTSLVERIIDNLERKLANPHCVDLKQACEIIAFSRHVKSETIRNCWRKTGFVPEDDIDSSDPEYKMNKEPLSTALSTYDKRLDENMPPRGISDNLTSVVFPEPTDEIILEEFQWTDRMGKDRGG